MAYDLAVPLPQMKFDKKINSKSNFSRMLKTYFRVVLATAWLVTMPAALYAQLVELTPNNQRPIVCTGTNRKLQSDFVSVESDAFFKPPYNRYNSKNYNMWLYLCASDNPRGCKNISTWTYDQKSCSGGSGVPCKWGWRLRPLAP